MKSFLSAHPRTEQLKKLGCEKKQKKTGKDKKTNGLLIAINQQVVPSMPRLPSAMPQRY